MGVVISYAQIFMNIAIQLVYTPLMIRLLGKSEYGVYTLVASVVSYLSLFSLGFTGAYMRFSSRAQEQGAKEEAKVNGMFLILFGIMSVCALTFGLLLSMYPKQLFGEKLSLSELSTAQTLMRILVINIALSFPISLFDSIIISKEKFIFQRSVMLLGTIVNPFVTLPLLLSGYGSISIVIVTTGITVCKLLINIYYALHIINAKFYIKELNIHLLQELATFSFFIFLNMVIDQINWNVDKLILGHTNGSSEIAVYGVGAQINSLYIMFSSTISNVFVPRVNRIALDENTQRRNEQFSELFNKVGRLQFAVLFLICSGFVLWGRYFIMNIYAGVEYSKSYWVAVLLIIPATIPLIQNLGIEVQRAVNKHKFRSITYFIMAIANICISIPLAISFGAVGSALGTAIGLLIANGIIMNWYYSEHLGINIRGFWKSIISLCRGLVVPILVGVGLKIFIKVDSVISFLGVVFLYSAIYCISMYCLGFNENEKRNFKQIIHRVK